MAALTVPGFDLADLRDGDKEMWLIRIPKQLSADSLCGPMTKSKLKLQNHAALRTHGQDLIKFQVNGENFKLEANDESLGSQIMNVLFSRADNALRPGRVFSRVFSVVDKVEPPTATSLAINSALLVTPYSQVPKVTGLRVRFKPPGAGLGEPPSAEPINAVGSKKRRDLGEERDVRAEAGSKKKTKKEKKAKKEKRN